MLNPCPSPRSSHERGREAALFPPPLFRCITTLIAMESLREGIGAAPIATAVAVTVVSYGVWWRWSESRRVRNFVRGSSSGVNSSILPSPMPALPRWCGFAGGHTLLMKTGKVRFSRPLVLLALVPVVLRLASLCGKFADELARNISSSSVTHLTKWYQGGVLLPLLSILKAFAYLLKTIYERGSNSRTDALGL